MFCKECGKSISDDSKFCSYCGSKVEPIESSDRPKPSTAETVDTNQGFTGVSAPMAESSREGSDNLKKINLKRTANFNWDLDGFPSEDNKKGKKVNLQWDDVLMQGSKKRSSMAGDVHGTEDASGLRTTGRFSFNGESAYGDESGSAGMMDSDEDDDSLHRMIFGYGPNESRPSRENPGGSGESASANSMDSNRVNKFYTFNKKNEEFQRLLDREYEKLKLDENYESTEDETDEVSPSNTKVQVQDNKSGEVSKPAGEATSESGASISGASMVSGSSEVSEPEAESAEVGGELQADGGGTPGNSETDLGLLEQEGNSEELLGDDTEAEKEEISAAVASGSGESMGGLTSKDAAGGAAALSAAGDGELELQEIVAAGESAGSGSSPGADTGAAQGEVTGAAAGAAAGAESGASLGELAGSGNSQGNTQGRKRRGRADNRKKTKFNFQAIFDDEDATSGSDSGEQVQAGQENSETTLKEGKVSEEKVSPEGLVATEDLNEEKEIDKTNDRDAVIGEVDDEYEEEERKPRSKALHALSILFYTILVIVIVILGIKLIAPDSSLAVKIDRTYDSIIHGITGKSSTTNPVENPEEMKTVDDWIADSASANQNIGKVQSDPELKVDITNKDFKGVDASKPFSDSTWYTDDDGKNIYYGPNIVKTVIAYYSDLNSAEGGVNGEKVQNLKIGEIRTGEFGFFVATSVNGKKDSESKYTVYVEPEGTSMKVSDVANAEKNE